MKLSYCKICNKEFESNTNGRYCSEVCRKISLNVNYQKRKYLKLCSFCGCEFKGKRQERKCEKCKDKNKPKVYKKRFVDIHCPQCNKLIDTEERNLTVHNSTRMGRTCEECKQRNKNGIIERMKINNPMFRPEVRAKSASTQLGRETKVEDYLELKNLEPKMTLEEVRIFNSVRIMGENNPMKNPAVVAKVQATRKIRYANGEIVYKKGKESALWKGNRNRAQTIRSRLYLPWIKPILERDNFTCCRCKKRGGRLEVHHIEPTFEQILNKILNGRRLFEVSYEDFEVISSEVVAAHKDVKGITYCVNCHKIVDPKRR